MPACHDPRDSCPLEYGANALLLIMLVPPPLPARYRRHGEGAAPECNRAISELPVPDYSCHACYKGSACRVLNCGGVRERN